MGNFISFPTVQDATLLNKWNSRYGCFTVLLFSIYGEDQFFLFLSMSTSSLGCQRMIIYLEESYMLDVGAPISSLLKGVAKLRVLRVGEPQGVRIYIRIDLRASYGWELDLHVPRI